MKTHLAFFLGTAMGSLGFAQTGSGGDSAMPPLQVKIDIAAPPARVWQALTTPAQIKQWFLGVDTETDWKVGSRIVHRGEYNGKPYEDKGTIREFTAPRVLAHDHWSAMSGLPDRPENYQLVRFELEPKGTGTTLTLTEKNIPDEEKQKVSEQTWHKVLANLKALAEKK